MPTVALGEIPHWTELDWTQPIYTPSTLRRYEDEQARLRQEEDWQALAELREEPAYPYEDTLLEHIDMPPAAKRIIQSYAEDRRLLELSGGSTTTRDLQFQQDLAVAQQVLGDTAAGGESSAGMSEQEIGDLQVQNDPWEFVFEPASGESQSSTPPVNALPTESVDSLLLEPPTFTPSGQTMWWQEWLVPRSFADEDITLMTYYDGIEDNPIDMTLLYLAKTQNADGSFGDRNKYYHTAKLAFVLSQIGKHNTEEYAEMIAYLRTANPQNNRDRALKARVLFSLDDAGYVSIMNELEAQIGRIAVDGIERKIGLGFRAGFEPDVVTMAEFTKASLVTNMHTDQLPFVMIWLRDRLPAEDDEQLQYHVWAELADALTPFRGYSYEFGGQTIEVTVFLDSIVQRYTERFSYSSSLDRSTDVIDTLQMLHVFQQNAADNEIIRSLREALPYYQYYDGSFGNSLYATTAALRALPAAELQVTDMEAGSVLRSRADSTLLVDIRNNGRLPLQRLSCSLYAEKQFITTIEHTLSTPVAALSTQTVSLPLPANATSRLVGTVEFLLYCEAPGDTNSANNWIERPLIVATSTTLDTNGAVAPSVPHTLRLYGTKGANALNVLGSVLYRDDPARQQLVVTALHEPTQTLYTQVVSTSGWQHGTVQNFSAVVPDVPDGEFTITISAKNASTDLYFADRPVPAKLDPLLDKIKGDVRLQFVDPVAPLVNVHVRTSSNNDVNATEGETNTLGEFTAIGHRIGLYTAQVDQAGYEALGHSYVIQEGEETYVPLVRTRGTTDTGAPQAIAVLLDGNSNPILSVAGGTYVAEVMAIDDGALDRAIFEYFDPVTATWNPMGTANFDGGNVAAFSWSIPAELSGDGYMVQASVYDQAGNQSSYVVTQDFEIVQPGVSVVGLQNNEWVAGASHDIVWSYPDQPGFIDQVKVIANGLSTTIANNVGTVPLGGPYTLTMPEQARVISNSAYLEISFCTPTWDCFTGFSEPFAVTGETDTPPPLPWHTPESVDLLMQTSFQDRRPLFNHDHNNGDRDMLYSEVAGLISTNPATRVYSIIYQAKRDDAWLEPVVIDQGVQLDGGDPKVLLQDVQARYHPSGSVTVVYSKQVGEDPAAQNSRSLHVAQVRDGGVLYRDQITTDDIQPEFPSLSVSEQGEVAVSWAAGFNVQTQSGDRELYVRKRTAGAWSEVEQLTTEGALHSAMIFQGNNPVVVYSDGDHLWLRRFSAAAWENPVRLRNPLVAKTTLDAFTEDAGKLAHIVEPDLLDTTQYRWLPSIQVESDLATVLQQQGFVRQEDILTVWRDAELGNRENAIVGVWVDNATYDLFVTKIISTDNLRHLLHMRVDLSQSAEPVLDVVEPVPVNGGYHAFDQQYLEYLHTGDGLYHLPYNRRENNGQERLRHIVYDGAALRLDTPISIEGRDIHIPGFLSGADQTLTSLYREEINNLPTTQRNTADLQTVFPGTVTLQQPAAGAVLSNSAPALSWQIGGDVDTVDVYVGQMPNTMNVVADNTTASTYTPTGLTANTVYYWQVVGSYQGAEFFSPVWHFTTGEQSTAAAEVVDRLIFYNNTSFDGNDAGASTADDSAIAIDKQALLLGQSAQFTHYSSMIHGINGIMIDVQGLHDASNISSADLEFYVGNTNSVDSWSIAPAPSSVSVRPGAGTDGSDRITIIWPDSTIQNQWIRVRLLPNERTGLATADEFYFGNVIGETGNSASDAIVDQTDFDDTQSNPHNFANPAAIDDVYDFNRDKRVDASDLVIVRDYASDISGEVLLITP